jgi:hypothetical protein
LFFNRHGPPPAFEEKNNSGTNQTNVGTDIDNAVDLEAEESCHYHITDEMHTPEAFTTFADWLYNTRPSVPETKEYCKSLLQAYVLAVYYEVTLLQNAIIDCFREHHTRVTVDLDHLVWMTNHNGDNTRLPMTAYLVQQIAYEIAQEGIEKYEKKNKSLPQYMKEGDSFVRYELVKAIAHRTQSSVKKAGDPATSDAGKWYVTELDGA